MGRFERGVRYYTPAIVQLDFPEDAICCRYCPLMRSLDGGTRHICARTGQILYNIDLQGRNCPVQVVMEEGVK